MSRKNALMKARRRQEKDRNRRLKPYLEYILEEYGPRKRIRKKPRGKERRIV